MDATSAWYQQRDARRKLEQSIWACIVTEPDAERLFRLFEAYPKWASRSVFEPRQRAHGSRFSGRVHALHLAVAWSRPSCLRALLRSHAVNVNKRSGRGTTALEEATLRFCEEFDENDANNALECLRLIALHPKLDHSVSYAHGALALSQVFEMPSRMRGPLPGRPPSSAWLKYARAALDVLLASPGICVFPDRSNFGGVVHHAIRIGEWDAANAALSCCTSHQLLQQTRCMSFYYSFRHADDISKKTLCAIENEIARRPRWILRSAVVRALVLTSKRGSGRAVLCHMPCKTAHLAES